MSHRYAAFEAQLRAHYPELLDMLRPGVPASRIDEIEAVLGRALPEDLRQAYLWRDGSVDTHFRYDELGPVLIQPLCSWCSLEALTMLWHRDRHSFDALDDDSVYFVSEDDEDSGWEDMAIRPWVAPPPEWLCIGYSGTRSRVYVDLLPGPKGQLGQLVYTDGEGRHRVVARSFHEYVEALGGAIDSGGVRYEDGQWICVESSLAFTVPGFE